MAGVSETHDPIQEQLIAARRTQILNAATKVFAEKGFHRATIKDIARTAGVADGTVYNYFGSKADVLIGILNRLNETEQRGEQFALPEGHDLRSFFSAYLRQRIRVLWPNAQVFQAILPEMLVNPELRDLYYRQLILPTMEIAERYFQAQIEQGRLRQMDVPLTTRAIAGNVLGLLLLQLLGDQEISKRWEDLPEVLTTLLLDGLDPDDDKL
ncbi:MAG TPA: helix-turn-helix domain-containing protein [Ktedonobacteraceae bacterium]|nr:helix-turn-helix domain-containing protein [Ktedonobacteraceae bacterium]